MDNIVIDVEAKKSLLIQESSEELRLRNIFQVNEIMGGNYWLVDENNKIKFKLNTRQVKILKIAMTMVNPKEKIDSDRPPISYSFTIDKLLEIMGENNNRLKYVDIPSFLTDLMGNDNFNYRDEKGNFILIHIFDKVVYKPDSQEVTFRFSWSMLEQFLTIENKEVGQYQSYILGNIMGFDSLYTINLYELCKVKLKGVRQRNFEISLIDLKIALDLCNNVNGEIEDIKYPRYYDFKKHILDKAIDEINNTINIDINVTYTGRKKGKSVNSLVFNIVNTKYKRRYSKKDNNEILDKDTINKVKQIIGHELISNSEEPLTDKSCIKIYKLVNGDFNIIQSKVDIAKTQDKIKNIGGWLISAINLNYDKPNKIKIVSSNFSDYSGQRNYDFDDLERKLLGWDEPQEEALEQIAIDLNE